MKLSKKIDDSMLQIKKSEQLALKYNDFGFHLAFSGGKDSQVIYELAKMAGVKFKAFFYKTSVDPPELLKFIRDNYPDVEWIKPEMTMYQLILKKGMLPLRQARYCCAFLKERQGINAVVIIGIRKAEGNKRMHRKEFEHICKNGQDKYMLMPILDWTNNQVYSFLENRKIKLCSIYTSRQRVGCVGCPMSPKTMREDFRDRPNFKLAYVNTVKKLMKKGKYPEFKSAEDVVNWWSSGLSRAVYMANKKQYKIKFKS